MGDSSRRGGGRTRASVLLAGLLLAGAASCVSAPPHDLVSAGDGQSSGSAPSPSPSPSPSPAPGTARQLFDGLEADLAAACGDCHAEDPAPFLVPPDRYASIVAWPGVVATSADQSLLITYPRTGTDHVGTNLEVGDLAETLVPRLREWLDREAEERAAAHPMLGPFEVAMGFNVLQLDELGEGLAGCVLGFDARELTSTVLRVSSLEIHAGPGGGVRVVHPLFAVVDQQGDTEPDPIDSFSEVDLSVDAGEVGDFAPGLVILGQWGSGARLSLAFEVLEPL